jgi:PTS system mannitol-specific IIC component
MGSAALVTFFGSMICLKFKKTNKSLAETQQEVMTMKNESKGLMPSVNQIIFACDAGMGSSAMGATKLKKLFQQEGIQGIEVIHKSVSEVPADAKIVLVHESLKEQVQKRNKVAHIITIKDFMNAPEYYALAKELKNNQLPSSKKVSNSIAETTKPKMLTFDHILLNQPVESIEKAIKCVGDLLLTNENITAQYIDSMLKRDQDVSVAIGNLIAIPHAINEDRKYIKKNGLAVVTYQKPID